MASNRQRHPNGERAPSGSLFRVGVVAAVGLFGALGGLARAGLAELPSAWPWPTLTANLVGTFLLGFVVRYGAHRWPTWLRIAAGVGALGALTTFST
ncbi:MAG: CrcB family protein, partial [Acidimicrobiia bacterium]|nr:CrcB family protein [Acidimicrobiia bacterium]